jgi:hypothetical protein
MSAQGPGSRVRRVIGLRGSRTVTPMQPRQSGVGWLTNTLPASRGVRRVEPQSFMPTRRYLRPGPADELFAHQPDTEGPDQAGRDRDRDAQPELSARPAPRHQHAEQRHGCDHGQGREVKPPHQDRAKPTLKSDVKAGLRRRGFLANVGSEPCGGWFLVIRAIMIIRSGPIITGSHVEYLARCFYVPQSTCGYVPLI